MFYGCSFKKVKSFIQNMLIYPVEKYVVMPSAVDTQIPMPLFRFDAGVAAFFGLAVAETWMSGSEGGYVEAFGKVFSETVIQSTLVVKSGTVIINGIVIQ